MKLFLQSVSLLLLAIAYPGVATAQTAPTNSGAGVSSTGNFINQPAGTRIYSNGSITTPNGGLMLPNVTVPGRNGATTFYYPDGSRITTHPNTINSSGTFLTPNSVNGGLETPQWQRNFNSGVLNRSR